MDALDKIDADYLVQLAKQEVRKGVVTRGGRGQDDEWVWFNYRYGGWTRCG